MGGQKHGFEKLKHLKLFLASLLPLMLFSFMTLNIVCPFVNLPTKITLAVDFRIVGTDCPVDMLRPYMSPLFLFLVKM